MADHHHRARPGVQVVLQGPEGVEVEVVAGLVQQHDVGQRRQHQQQLEPALFAPREGPDRRPLGVGVEPEPFHEADLVPARLALATGHGFPHPLGRVEVPAGLVVVTEANRRARLHPSRGRGQPAGHDVEKGGLAGPVGTHHAQALPGAEVQLEVLEQRGPGAVAVSHAVKLEDPVAQPGRGAPLPPAGQVQVPGPVGGGATGLHDGGGRGDAGLGLAGTGRGPPAQPGQLGPGQVPPHRLGSGLPLGPLGGGRQIAAVAPVVQVAPPPVELEDAGADPIEDVAVMGDHHEPTSKAGQAILQPGDGVDVEVVGGLVQDQEVDLVHQHPGQGHPLGLTPRKRGHVGFDQPPHPQPLQDDGGLPVLAHRRAHVAGRKHGPLGEEADPNAPASPGRSLLRALLAGQRS